MLKVKGKYVLDGKVTLEKCYDLLCTILANKEIARRSDSMKPSPIAQLEVLYFDAKVSRLLVEIAASIRVITDQFAALNKSDQDRINFDKQLQKADQYEFGLFDDLDLTLRETCNKIIHSDIFEPHFKGGIEGNEFDIAYLAGVMPKSIDWKHASGLIRLKGKKGKHEWFVLLDVEAFVSAIYTLIS